MELEEEKFRKCGHMIKIALDGLDIELKCFHDISWLKEYGHAFCVFDRLVSGNLCFGMELRGVKHFIKYAGAPTLNYAGDPQAAVQRLKAAEEKYDQLKHPKLSRKVSRFENVSGFGLVFDWFDGFALAPLEAHMRAMRELPIQTRLRLFDGLADFMVQASNRDYVLSGFSDRHILIDFSRFDAIICSADNMVLMPAKTPYPKMPGSPFYMPPEGYAPGAKLDEKSNIYVMGALAFTFFGNRAITNGTGWEAGSLLYETAKQAVSDDPDKRPNTASAFLERWRGTVLHFPLL